MKQRSESGLIFKGCLFLLLLLIIVGGAGGYGLTHFTVQTEQGWKCYMKDGLFVKDYYVDIREMSLFDLPPHRELVVAMEKAGDVELLPSSGAFTKAAFFGVSASGVLDKVEAVQKLTGNTKEYKDSTVEKMSEAGEKIKQKVGEYSEKAKEQAEKFQAWLKSLGEKE